MAAAKSLTPAELQTVLAYTATQPYAQRNRAMLMMTVAAGLRVSEVAGLTLGDILDSKGAVRGEVFLAAHRVKHQHARTIYLNSRLQQELADYNPFEGLGGYTMHYFEKKEWKVFVFVDVDQLLGMISRLQRSIDKQFISELTARRAIYSESYD